MRTIPRGVPVTLSVLTALAALTACSVESAETVDLFSFTNGAGSACTALVVVAAWSTDDVDPGDEVESSIDCELPPAGRQPVVEERLSFPDPEPEREWGLREVITMTDAHGRACTAVATVLESGEVEETGLDCDYPPEGRSPGAVSRRAHPDPPDEGFDRGSVQFASFDDAHGRVCTTSASYADAEEPLFGDGPFGEGVEIDLTCEYVQTGAVAAEEPAGSSG